jgi:hypothetical protein
VWVTRLLARLGFVATAIAYGPGADAAATEAAPDSRLIRMSCATAAAELDPDLDPQQLPAYSVSPLADLRIVESQDLAARWTWGTGLELVPNGPAPMLVVGAPIFLGDHGTTQALLRIESPSSGAIEIDWTDKKCKAFAPPCVGKRIDFPAGRSSAVIDLAPEVDGRARSLRLRPLLPDGGPLTLRSVRSIAPGESVASRTPTEDIDVFSPEIRPTVESTHHLRTSFEPGRGLGVRFDKTADQIFDPYFTLAFGDEARPPVFAIIEGVGIGGHAVELFFTSEACPDFSEACKVSLDRVSDEVFAADLSAAAGWKGRISQLRLDFLGAEPTEFTIRALRFSSEPPARVREVVAHEFVRGPDRLSRLDGGRLGWTVHGGETLRCSLAANDEGEGLALPTAIEVRIPPGPSGIEQLEVRAEWLLSDGTRTPAARYTDNRAAPRAADWTSIPLGVPPDRRAGLLVSVACFRNCAAETEPRVRIDVAQPFSSARHGKMPPNLLLISIDTLRADHLPSYGHSGVSAPTLDALAAESTVYERVFAVDTWTLPTHAALFTGTYPVWLGTGMWRAVPLDVLTLAELLAAEGYATIAATDGIVMTAAQGIDQGFDRFDARLEPIEAKTEAFVRDVREIAAGGSPVFAFLHTYAVHTPYSIAREGFDRSFGARRLSGTVSMPVQDLPDLVPYLNNDPFREARVRYLEAHYDRGIELVDAALERLFSDPRLREFLARAVVVVTSDHGEEFWEHGGLEHSRRMPHRELTHVPLLVRSPGQTKGERVEAPVSQTEIPRLILERLGLAPAFPERPCQGFGHPFALLRSISPSDYPPDGFLTTAAYDRDYELIQSARLDDGELVLESARSLSEGKAVPVANLPSSLTDALRCFRDHMRPLAQAVAAEPAAEIPAASRDRLRALGYVDD